MVTIRRVTDTQQISDYRRMMEEAVLCLKPGGLLVLVEFHWQLYDEDKVTPAQELSDDSPRGSALQRIFHGKRYLLRFYHTLTVVPRIKGGCDSQRQWTGSCVRRTR